MSDIFNPDELIIDKFRSLVANDLATGMMLYRQTSIEDPSLKCSSEGEEITDAFGSAITTLYRAKKATLSGSNSLFSLGLAAEQFGAKKQIGGLKDYTYGNAADKSALITTSTYEILTIENGKITLSNKASNDIKYIYTIENNEISNVFTAGAVVSEKEFVVDDTGLVTVINTPTNLTGKVYVEYQYETLNAVKISNRASEQPRAVSLRAYAYFKDKCNENLTYSGVIICHKAKINPETIDIALTSTGKHAFEYQMMKDYCAEEGDDELFSVIVAK